MTMARLERSTSQELAGRVKMRRTRLTLGGLQSMCNQGCLVQLRVWAGYPSADTSMSQLPWIGKEDGCEETEDENARDNCHVHSPSLTLSMIVVVCGWSGLG